MAEYKKYSEIPASQTDEWKVKYPGMMSVLEIEMDEEGDVIDEPRVARFIVHKPSRTVMDAVGELGIKKELTKANKMLIGNCVLGGDKDILEMDGTVYGEVIANIEKMMSARKSSLKKL